MKTVVHMLSGGRVYGTSTPDSDTDYKAVHLPPANDILLQRVADRVGHSTKNGATKNDACDVDFESFSLQKYLENLLSGQPVALSMLFTPEQFIQENSPLWQHIISNRSRWLHRDIKPILSFCKNWAKRASIPAKGGQPVDWKGLSHAVRVCREAEELLLHHTITYPRPEAELIRNIRSASLTQSEVATIVEAGVARLDECLMLTTLPERPDVDAAERIVVEHYRSIVTSEDATLTAFG